MNINTIASGIADITIDGKSIGTVERYQHFTGRQDQHGIPETHTAWAAYSGRSMVGSYGLQQDRISHAEVRNQPTRKAAAEALLAQLGR